MSNATIAIAIAMDHTVKLVIIRIEARSGFTPAVTAATAAN
jgi:hypothetical protein